MTRLGWARLAAYVAVVVAGAWGINGVRVQGDRLERVVADQRAEGVARCEARNEATRTSVLIVVDALVAATTDGADPDRVAAFRSDIDARLSAAEVDCT